jgi:hypothetical protein
MRQIPIWLAERTGEIAVRNRSLVLVYIVGLFIVVPVGILLVT